MTEEERSRIKKLMENEQAEWAMRECIGEYRENYMPVAMAVRGIYEAMMNVGFDANQSALFTLNYIGSIGK